MITHRYETYPALRCKRPFTRRSDPFTGESNQSQWLQKVSPPLKLFNRAYESAHCLLEYIPVVK